MKKLTIGLLLGLSVFAGNVMAAGDAAAGKTKSAICATCHGQDGIAIIPGYPNLKGQNERYIISSIKAYKNKERSGGFSMLMQAQSMMLSDQDIEDLAAYYSSMK